MGIAIINDGHDACQVGDCPDGSMRKGCVLEGDSMGSKLFLSWLQLIACYDKLNHKKARRNYNFSSA